MTTINDITMSTKPEMIRSANAEMFRTNLKNQFDKERHTLTDKISDLQSEKMRLISNLYPKTADSLVFGENVNLSQFTKRIYEINYEIESIKDSLEVLENTITEVFGTDKTNSKKTTK